MVHVLSRASARTSTSCQCLVIWGTSKPQDPRSRVLLIFRAMQTHQGLGSIRERVNHLSGNHVTYQKVTVSQSVGIWVILSRSAAIYKFRTGHGVILNRFGQANPTRTAPWLVFHRTTLGYHGTADPPSNPKCQVQSPHYWKSKRGKNINLAESGRHHGESRDLQA
jgi:hypothetical protein